MTQFNSYTLTFFMFYAKCEFVPNFNRCIPLLFENNVFYRCDNNCFLDSATCLFIITTIGSTLFNGHCQ